jgi:uncharacterized membrane protein (DUF4010 family)
MEPPPDLNTIFQKLGIALGLGLLVGMQRQLTKSELAGIRTFPLITLLGSFSALLAQKFGGWIIAGATVAIAGIIFAGNLSLREKANTHESPGITTEVAALLMFAVGAYLIVGEIPVAVAAGGCAAVLLQFKDPLHKFVERIGDKDAYAIGKFVLIALVILPLLPNKTFGPYEVFNPFETWMVVVLIFGIGLAAYICQRMFGSKGGTFLGGILGGLISSTATTVSYARISKTSDAASTSALIVILLASTIVFARMIIEICFVAGSKAIELVPPVGLMLGVMMLIAGLVYVRKNKANQIGKDNQENANPADLKGALTFAVVYSAILFAVAAARDFFGSNALWLVSIISGLTDVDALTLSTSRLAASGRLDSATASQLILVGALSNLLFKGGVVFSLGARKLSRELAIAFGFAIVAGVAIILLWKPVRDFQEKISDQPKSTCQPFMLIKFPDS